MAEVEGFPIDLDNISIGKEQDDSVNEYETPSNSSGETEQSTAKEHEYMKLFSEKAESRKALESKAAAGQQNRQKM